MLLRPSYVIGGQNMTISRSPEETERYMQGFSPKALTIRCSSTNICPHELEVDVISDGENVLISGIMEHIERAGVH